VFVRKKDAENVESLNKDQDPVARFPTSHASHIEPASTSIMKNTGHSDAGQSQEVGSDILLSDSMSLCHYVASMEVVSFCLGKKTVCQLVKLEYKILLLVTYKRKLWVM